jgi:hypothetical protein
MYHHPQSPRRICLPCGWYSPVEEEGEKNEFMNIFSCSAKSKITYALDELNVLHRLVIFESYVICLFDELQLINFRLLWDSQCFHCFFVEIQS